MSKNRDRGRTKTSRGNQRRPRVQMTRYPSIEGPNFDVIGQHCIAFEKHDGSNLQFSWNQNEGWYRYGTRKRTVLKDNPLFGSAIEMFHQKYGDEILKVVRKYKEYRNTKKLTAFCEFFGEKTFSGLHVDGDPKKLKMFDIMMEDTNLVIPIDFKNHFGHLDIPSIVYEGELTKEFMADVRAGKLDVTEGIVAKGVKVTQRRKGKSERVPWMVKVKTQTWLNELQKRAGDTPDKFQSEWQENEQQQSKVEPGQS